MTGDPQLTLRGPVSFEGVGLHTGERGRLTFRPAPANSGIVFERADLPGRPTVLVRPENAMFDPRAARRTILMQHDVQIHTMEHVLAALAGVGLDNVVVETTTMEVPEPADGSAAPIARLLMETGFVEQDQPKRHIKVTKPVRWAENGVELSAVPYRGLKITFTIDYDHAMIGRQTLSLDITPESFIRDIAPARTFVLERDLEQLRKCGWIKGGTLDSAVVVGDTKILNPGPLRFPDEFVRHKVLDLLGDLTLLGGPLLGHVSALRSGHQGHVAFVKELKRSLPLPGRRAGGPPGEWDITAVMDIMPHRYPFLLVDRITSLVEGRSIEGLKNVTINEPFFQGHFPGHPIMPAVLILEAMAQVGGLLLLNSVDDPSEKLMYFAAIDGARFRRPVTPGDQLRFKLVLVKHRGATAKMRGEAFVDDQLVAEADLLARSSTGTRCERAVGPRERGRRSRGAARAGGGRRTGRRDRPARPHRRGHARRQPRDGGGVDDHRVRLPAPSRRGGGRPAAGPQVHRRRLVPRGRRPDRSSRVRDAPPRDRAWRDDARGLGLPAHGVLAHRAQLPHR